MGCWRSYPCVKNFHQVDGTRPEEAIGRGSRSQIKLAIRQRHPAPHEGGQPPRQLARGRSRAEAHGTHEFISIKVAKGGSGDAKGRGRPPRATPRIRECNSPETRPCTCSAPPSNRTAQDRLPDSDGTSRVRELEFDERCWRVATKAWRRASVRTGKARERYGTSCSANSREASRRPGAGCRKGSPTVAESSGTVTFGFSVWGEPRMPNQDDPCTCKRTF